MMTIEIVMGVFGVLIYALALYYGIRIVESVRKDQETALRCLFIRYEAKKAFKALFLAGFTFNVGYGLSIITSMLLENNTHLFELIIGVTAILSSIIVLYAFKNLCKATISPEKYKDMN